jgi:uncharacterized phage protein (TIGR02218 family)
MKSASTELINNIAKNVTSFATLITMTRSDGVTLRFTQHDRPITYNGTYFRNDVPYNLSAIDTNSDLSVDTTTLEVAIDGTVFTHADVFNDVYRGGQIEIALVDWRDLSSGKMVLREGWFTQVEDDRPNSLSFEIGGLMKVLDMGVGRIYQPTCDADLGDKRCRVALDPEQSHSYRNPVVQGDWAYVYDRTRLTAITGTNLDFETGDLTGWEVSSGAVWQSASPITGLLPTQGSYYATGASGGAAEQFLAQSFDLVGAGASETDIDAGKIAFVLFALFAQVTDLSTTFPKFVLEQYDADGVLIATKDTRYLILDDENAWRERCLHLNVRPGVRSVKLYLYGKTKTGSVAQVAFDDIQPYWYDITADSPTHNLIFKCVRTPNLTQPTNLYAVVNAGFEKGNASTSTTENIEGWTKNGSPWGVTSGSLSSITPPFGLRMLVAGDDSSGVQKTYTIYNEIVFNASWVDLTRLAQGKYVGRLQGTIVYGDANASAGEVDIVFNDGTDDIGTITSPLGTHGSIAAVPFETTFTVPVNTVKARIVLKATSPVDASLAKIAYDGIRLDMVDAERPNAAVDLRFGFGDSATEFDFTEGHYSQDGQLIWRAFNTWRQVDTVAAVGDRKTFNGTAIVGDFGAYETARIEWLSGNNAGKSGLVRTWFPPTKTIKTYFPQMADIQTGDKFIYYPSCQKRFAEDCIFKFNNAINFQGIPYLPGAVAPDSDSAPVNVEAPTSTPPATLSNFTTPTTSADGTVTFPSGMKAGDLVVVAAWQNNDGSPLPAAPTSDWKIAGSVADTASGAQCSAVIFYKIASAQDIVDATATFTNTTLNACWSGSPSASIAQLRVSVPVASSGNGTSTPAPHAVPLIAGNEGLPGLYVAITGADNAHAVTVDNTALLQPSGQTGVQIISYPNLISSTVAPRALDTTSVKCSYLWAPGGAITMGAKRGTGPSGSQTVLLALYIGVVGGS